MKIIVPVVVLSLLNIIPKIVEMAISLASTAAKEQDSTSITEHHSEYSTEAYHQENGSVPHQLMNSTLNNSSLAKKWNNVDMTGDSGGDHNDLLPYIVFRKFRSIAVHIIPFVIALYYNIKIFRAIHDRNKMTPCRRVTPNKDKQSKKQQDEPYRPVRMNSMSSNASNMSSITLDSYQKALKDRLFPASTTQGPLLSQHTDDSSPEVEEFDQMDGPITMKMTIKGARILVKDGGMEGNASNEEFSCGAKERQFEDKLALMNMVCLNILTKYHWIGKFSDLIV